MANALAQVEEPAVDEAALLAEVAARRQRLSANLDALGLRLQPANLLAEAVDAGREAITREVHKLRDEVLDLGADLIEDSLAWASSNRRLLIGGSATAMVAAVGIMLATRRRPVPLYAAYDMEDPNMMTDKDKLDEAATGAARAWEQVKESADDLGHSVIDKAGELSNRASETYYAARARAANLGEAAREQAAMAADIARERALEAADAAREAAERASEAAGEASRWARRQSQENPMTMVVVALAVGALVGALVSSGRRRREDHDEA